MKKTEIKGEDVKKNKTGTIREIKINGKMMRLTNKIKRKFIPTEEERAKLGNNVVKSVKMEKIKKVKVQEKGDPKKEILMRYIEDQRGVNELFTGWEKREEFKTWDEFMDWHKGKVKK